MVVNNRILLFKVSGENRALCLRKSLSLKSSLLVYFPVKNPLPNGEYGTKPIPSSSRVAVGMEMGMISSMDEIKDDHEGQQDSCAILNAKNACNGIFLLNSAAKSKFDRFGWR